MDNTDIKIEQRQKDIEKLQLNLKELQKDIEKLQLNLKELQEQKRNPTYSIGQFFQIRDCLYPKFLYLVKTNLAPCEVALICLDNVYSYSGRRWGPPAVVVDPEAITSEEMKKIYSVRVDELIPVKIDVNSIPYTPINS